jgi:hypothetical protein
MVPSSALRLIQKMGFETIVQPPEPEDINNLLMVKQWEFAYKPYYDQVQRWAVASGQAFTVILGQCLPAVVDRVQAHEDWDEVSQENNVIGFLCLIRGCMYGSTTNKYLEHTILDVQTKLLTLRQSSRISNAEYLQSFRGLVDTLEYLGGEIGVEEGRITSY